jgi:hypothetical protein
MRFRTTRRRTPNALVAPLAALLLSLTMVPTTMAARDPAKGSPAPVGAGVSMYLDCSSVPDTKEARAATRRYHICADSPGGVTPMSEVSSNCGTLSLFVSNDFAGALQWRGRITSKLGPFTLASYGGNWSNLTNGRNGPISRNYGGITSDWLDVLSINTGPGSVFGNISVAIVRLWWGAYCISTLPVDSHAIVT